MKRKILSFVICLMLCLSAMSVFTACKEEDNTLSKSKAERELAVAFAAIETADDVLMEVNTEVGKLIFFASENSYFYEDPLIGNQTWSEKESGIWYDYAKYIEYIGEQPAIKFVKRLSLDIKEDPRLSISAYSQKLTEKVFLKAIKEKGEIKITYKEIQEGTTIKYTYIVVGGKLQTIEVDAGNSDSSITYMYNQDAIDNTTRKPNSVEWDVYVPHIEVAGIKAQYHVGEVLNYSSLVLNYFEDDETEIPEEMEITPDMVTGFETTEAGNYQMTIKFLNLTLEIDYEVIE